MTMTSGERGEGFRSVSEIMPDVFRGAGHKERVSLKLNDAWSRIVSKTGLLHTDNVVLSKRNENDIVIYVDSNTWAAEFSMNREYYRKCFSEILMRDIHEVIFLVTKDERYMKSKVADEGKPAYIDDWESAELSADELQKLEEMVSVVSDRKLRENLFRAILSDFEWKKGNPDLNKP